MQFLVLTSIVVYGLAILTYKLDLILSGKAIQTNYVLQGKQLTAVRM